ncbi:MAG: hypothetical protein COZ75_03480 [Flavobacteriaceae bacterium CG_4_8_14_3_um_filter_34_10]|nr:hypothetical protein [Flavobacteriia bacterium]OIP49314.1 MAG: hypothetical protein AUK33_10750 [Flavobacteriaceae bacterium CG2_30_34_30]PIQ17484.1 MAG: hypothetical protein COW66_11500 [Flavobacteriaceae bacterium CG18_big_fil_WC_8_21_14_2_50_34_36]PIV50266.1 MAG: hypothetical protein COS19_04645 [Flavobacteriaceae bacterium CG02_land_8_20_14_3_00_34_13]PIX10070.1 MAG: hypothetical protein COZ75_03480 [Flavobacteriaceae bacterium CG_4_8_14_3_um_filter_34_10]PIZ06843.1 MAG: hypothetical pr
MKRVIVDFKKLTPDILSLLVEKYPYGYEEEDIITFKNVKGEIIEAIEVRNEEDIYLVKVSSKLVNSMANFDLDDYDEADYYEPIAELPEKTIEEIEDEETPDENLI